MIPSWLPTATTDESPALQGREVTWTWSQFQQEITERATLLANLSGQRVGLLMDTDAASLANLAALAAVGAHVFLTSADATTEQLQQQAARFDWFSICGPDRKPNLPALPGSPTDRVTILTSGTTGDPKAAEHTWTSLLRPVRDVPPGQRWLLTYRPHLYAGLQVMLQCLYNAGTLVLPSRSADAQSVAELARDARVEYASATPSYWRWLLTLAAPETLSAIPLQQITLGGEAVDQPTLDRLQRTFPQTRMVHIYATTELGRCFSVSDGRAGFPKAYLEQPTPDGVSLRVDAGELVVRSANAMQGYDQDPSNGLPQQWFPTGDLVEVTEDRVHFVGRKTEMINVGGNKVSPLQVEDVLRSVDGVADVRVYGQASSIVGQIVACDVVVSPGFDPHPVETQLRECALQKLSTYQRPRLIQIVPEIRRTDAGKTRRGE